MITADQIKSYVETELQASPYFLVDVAPLPDSGFDVEIDSFSPVDIDYCADLSRRISGHFGEELDDYDLQVGSAGLTSPLRVPRQYEKYLGKDVEVLTADGHKLRGILKEADDTGFVLQTVVKVKKEGVKKPVEEIRDIPLDYNQVKYTKYILQF